MYLFQHVYKKINSVICNSSSFRSVVSAYAKGVQYIPDGECERHTAPSAVDACSARGVSTASGVCPDAISPETPVASSGYVLLYY